MRKIYCCYNFAIIFYTLHRIQTEGLGGLKPNTIIICWPTQWKKEFETYTAEAFIRMFISDFDVIYSIEVYFRYDCYC